MENRVKFKIGDIEFEAEGTAEVIEKERSIFLNSILPAAIDAVVRTRTVEPLNNEKYIDLNVDTSQLLDYKAINNYELEKDIDLSRTNLVTFLKPYGNLNDQDFVLFAAYYEEKKNLIKSFSSEVVKKFYSDARRVEYSNISELLRRLAQKGLIMDEPNAEQKIPKTYIITSEGINYIQSYVPKTGDNDKKVNNRPKKKRAKTDSVYASLCADDLNLQNYPEIKSFNNFKDQMILVMYIFLNENKGKAFSVQDIECIMTDILGLPATSDQINGIFRRNKVWFKKEADPNNARIVKHILLQGGKDYAKGLMKG